MQEGVSDAFSVVLLEQVDFQGFVMHILALAGQCPGCSPLELAPCPHLQRRTYHAPVDPNSAKSSKTVCSPFVLVPCKGLLMSFIASSSILS